MLKQKTWKGTKKRCPPSKRTLFLKNSTFVQRTIRKTSLQGKSKRMISKSQLLQKKYVLRKKAKQIKKETQLLYRDITELEANKEETSGATEAAPEVGIYPEANTTLANLFNGSPADAERFSVYHTYINSAVRKVKALKETMTPKAKYNKLKEKQQQSLALQDYLRTSESLKKQQNQRQNTLLTLKVVSKSIKTNWNSCRSKRRKFIRF